MDATLAGTFAIGGDLVVPRMGFGAMRLVGPNVWGEPDDPANSLAVLRRAVALGVDLIDTAEVYGPFVNERQIAEALHPYQPGLVIATKCGIRRDWPEGVSAPEVTITGSEQAIRASIEGSLKRLRVDAIDLYQVHRLSVDLEGEMAVLAALREEGKVRHVGVSEVNVDQLAQARAIVPIATVQNRYNLFERAHDPVLAACEAAGIGFLPWFPVGGSPAKVAADPVVAPIAARLGATPVQVALAWLLARSPVMIPIPGTASLAHLEENIASASLTLSDADMAALNGIAHAG